MLLYEDGLIRNVVPLFYNHIIEVWVICLMILQVKYLMKI